MTKATYTTILHAKRWELGLSWLEYGLADVIDKLSNPTCYAGMDLLVEIMGVSERTVQRMLTVLREKGLIEGKVGSLKSTDYWIESTRVEKRQIGGESVKLAGQKRQIGEHTIYINKDNIDDSLKSSSEKSSEKLVQGNAERDKMKQLPFDLGKQPLQRIVYVYNLLWKDMYGFEPQIQNWGKLGKLYKPLLKSYSEFQIAALVIVHFSWRGATGDSQFDEKMLQDKCYPLDWIPARVNNYRAYLTNVLNVNFDDDVSVKNWVVGIIKPLIGTQHVNSSGEDQ